MKCWRLKTNKGRNAWVEFEKSKMPYLQSCPRRHLNPGLYVNFDINKKNSVFVTSVCFHNFLIPRLDGESGSDSKVKHEWDPVTSQT